MINARWHRGRLSENVERPDAPDQRRIAVVFTAVFLLAHLCETPDGEVIFFSGERNELVLVEPARQRAWTPAKFGVSSADRFVDWPLFDCVFADR